MTQCNHQWVAKAGKDGKPDFQLDRKICAVPLALVTCSLCKAKTFQTENQFMRDNGQTEPLPKWANIVETKIDEIVTEFDALELSMLEKASSARATARRAHKKGDLRKWDKFNAVARVYEMIHEKMTRITGELFEHTSEEYKSQNIPF